MSGGSSVRSLLLGFLKATRDEIDRVFRVGSISRPVAHHHCLSFDLSSLNWKVAWLNSGKINCSSSFIEQRLHLAICCWAKMDEETRPKISSSRRGGGRNKRRLRNQRKYVQNSQQRQGVEDAGRQLCQVVKIEASESNKR